MARKCDICGKGPQFGHNVSHSQRKTQKVWSANIQKARIMVDGKPCSVSICTKCMKSDTIKKAI